MSLTRKTNEISTLSNVPKLSREIRSLDVFLSLYCFGDAENLSPPFVFVVIFVFLYTIFHSVAESAVLISRHCMRSPADSFCRNCLVITQRGRLGRLYRSVRDRGGNRRRDGRLPSRSVEPPARERTTAKGRRHRGSHHRRCGATSTAETRDRVRRARRPDPDLGGKRRRRRCHEAHSRAHRRQHDHVHNSRADSGARIFAVKKERALRLWQLTAERTTGRRLKIFAVI